MSLIEFPTHSSHVNEGICQMTSKWALVAAAVTGVVLTTLSAAGTLDMLMISVAGCWALASVGGALLLVGSIGLMVRGCYARPNHKNSKPLIEIPPALQHVLQEVSGEAGLIAIEPTDFKAEFDAINDLVPKANTLYVSKKCRYGNIAPYASNIFQLPNGYINASILPSGHILTQGPLPNTIDDFWEMAWQSEATCIMMVTDFQERDEKKCAVYIPDAQTSSMTFGEISISHIGAPPTFGLRPLIERRLVLTKGEEKREITHYHQTSWIDHAVIPLTRLDTLIEIIERNPKSIIHCSAGVGRSGVVEACYRLKQLHQLAQKQEVCWQVDIQKLVAHLRSPPNGRAEMVASKAQYELLYAYVKHLQKKIK